MGRENGRWEGICKSESKEAKCGPRASPVLLGVENGQNQGTEAQLGAFGEF